MVLHQRNNIAASFMEHQEFPEEGSFTREIWVSSEKLKSRIRTLYTLKMLYRECSTKGAILLFLPKST